MPRKTAPPDKDSPPDAHWTFAALEHAEMSGPDLAKAMADAGLINQVDRSVPNKIIRGERRFKPGEPEVIARVTGFVPFDPTHPTGQRPDKEPDRRSAAIAALVAATELSKKPAKPPSKSIDLSLRSVVVAAHVQAGYWAETWEWSDDERYEVAVPRDPVLDGFTLYGAETRGPSMNRRWPEKTVVVFTDVMETEEAPQAGKRYVVERRRADGAREHTVKLLHRDENGAFWLVPESTDPLFQEPISVLEGTKDNDEVRIVGRVRFSVARE